MKPMDSIDDGDVVKSADRALAIIALVGDRGPIRFNELIKELGLARSSAHGLLRTLVLRGWLHHDSETRSYALGLRAWQTGQQYAGHREFAALAKPKMDLLAQTVGETVQLARLDGVENVYIAISEGTHPMRLASSVGMRLHAHATALGKMLLSQIDPADAEKRLASVVLPRFTETTITDLEPLLEALREARTRGYALDEGEYLAGTRCVAVPLINDGAGLVAAMSMTAPSSRCAREWPDSVLGHLRETASVVRSQLGIRHLPTSG